MRSAWRFGVAVFVALALADAATWLWMQANALSLVRAALTGVLAFVLVRWVRRDRSLVPAALLGSLAVEEAYLVLYGLVRDRHFDAERLVKPELLVLALARGFGLFMAARGKARAIDGLLLAMPVVVVDFLLSAVAAVRALGESFSVGSVTPHLGIVLVSGAVVSIVVPLVAGIQRE